MVGTHLIIDARNVRRNLKGERGRDTLYAILSQLPPLLEMEKLMDEPHIVEVNENHSESDGFSGFMMIKESHVSIHTFPGLGQYYADIFSCKPFATEIVLNYFRLIFGGEVHVRVVDRGKW